MFRRLKEIFLFSRCQSLENIRKLGFIVGFSNIVTCLIFYLWLSLHVNRGSISISNSLLITSISIHLYLNFLFVNWSLSFEGAKWIMWGWLSFIFLSPLGLGLIAVCANPNNWKFRRGYRLSKKQSVFHSMTNSFVNLQNQLMNSLNYLYKTYPQETIDLLKMLRFREDPKTWSNRQKFLIMALCEALRQTKKKSNFDDVVFDAHWYDRRHFDFAIKDPKSKLIPNRRYIYSLAFIILDEFNNYQKILDGKKEIKQNMKFGPAKTVCLHWGKGFKVYVNE